VSIRELANFHQAVESLNKICEQLSQAQVEEHFIPLTVRLSKADWFTSKISATGLYNVPYGRATPPSQEGLRHQFGQLVHDDTPMVRRQSANNLAKFVKAMPATIVIEEMIPLFQHLASDDQDSVRLLTVDILIAIAEVVPKEQQSSHGVLLTALRNLFEDKSWRVRYMVADRFEKVSPFGLASWLLLTCGHRSPKQWTRRSSVGTWFLHS
jgi:serine/threonine-protein phosphatase 2A regulatory subunit A